MEIKDVFEEIKGLETERKTLNLEELNLEQVVKLSILDNISGIFKISELCSEIVLAGKLWAKSLKSGGRIVLLGAGTSGRLAIMEAAEMYPTFGIKKRVLGFIAGGKNSVFLSKEGAEDSEASGRKLVNRLKVSRRDLVVGLSASGRTPYVKGAMDRARELGCPTVLISTNKNVKIDADIKICVNSGPEILPGSTRMKSATVQKVVLNTLSLLGAILSGRVERGRMVKMKATSKKLKARGIKTLVEEFSIDENEAYEILLTFNWDLKKAFEFLKCKYRAGSLKDIR